MKKLETYLNDHLAGSVAALELIEHWRERYKQQPTGSFLGGLKKDIEADRDTLCEVMHSLGIDESIIRQTGAWAAEKLARARLKIAGDETGLVLALEGLIMGILGKRMMWRSLAAANVPNSPKWDFDELQRRAERQIEQTEVERIRAMKRAFNSPGD